MTHRIRKAVFVLDCPNQGSALRTMKRFETDLETSILPALERIFDDVSPGTDELRIDRLEVDLGEVDPERIPARTLTDAVQRAIRRVTGGRRSRGEAVMETLVDFLRTGRLAWDAPADSVTELERLLLALPKPERDRVIHGLRVPLSDRSACLRLTHQFGPELFDTIFQFFTSTGASYAHPAGASALFEDKPESRAEALYSAITSDLPGFESRATTSIGGTAGRQGSETSSLLQSTTSAVPSQSGERETDPPVPAEASGFPIANAGLVLLHPHLARLFTLCGFLDNSHGFRSPEAHHDAVLALHYAATGNIEADEHQLALPRVLCGCPDEQPTARRSFLPSEVLTETERLLQAVVTHWSRLGSTSIDGLREGFLSRPGILVLEDSGWRVRVERRGIDVLLGSLPWGVSIIRLPWMRRELHVDWA